MGNKNWIDALWEESPLPIGVANRLKRADKALQAIEAIHQTMHEDFDGKVGNEEVAEGLSLVDIERLHLAMEGLIALAAEMFEEVREGSHGCHETPPHRTETRSGEQVAA